MRRSEARARVERGAALLDRAMPSWVERIDLETLKLRSACDCVCGQLGQRSRSPKVREMMDDYDYSPFLAFSYWLDGRFGEARADTEANGFVVMHDADGSGWALIEREWRRLIVARRKEAARNAV